MEEESYSSDLGGVDGWWGGGGVREESLYAFRDFPKIIQTREKPVHMQCVPAVLVRSCHTASVIDRQVPISQ